MKLHAMIRVLIIAVSALALPSHAQADARQKRGGAAARTPRAAAPKVTFASGDSALKIPLEFDGNLFFMRVSVNHSKPLKFIFDTAASVSAISRTRAEGLGLKAEGELRGEGTGGTFQASLIKGVTLGVQGAEVSDQLMATMPLDQAPVEFDGVIGYDFINQFVVEIDYRNKTMSLYNPRTYTYSGRGETVPLALAGRRTPLARAELTTEGRAPLEVTLELDTGWDGAFLLNSPFVRKQGLLSSVPDTVEGGGVGAGGEQRLRIGLAKSVRLGRLTFAGPTLALSLDTEGSGASEKTDGLVGGEIFRRFKVIFDYSRSRMILEPNESFNDPFEKSTYGSD